MSTYRLRWAVFGPGPLPSGEFRAAIYPVLREHGLDITSTTRLVVPVRMELLTDPETEAVDGIVRGGPFDGWMAVADPEQLARITTITGFAWEVSGRRIADDAERRLLQRHLNAAVGARMEPMGFFGYGPGVHVRGLREPDPTYAALDRPWPAIAIGVALLGVASVARHA